MAWQSHPPERPLNSWPQRTQGPLKGPQNERDHSRWQHNRDEGKKVTPASVNHINVDDDNDDPENEGWHGLDSTWAKGKEYSHQYDEEQRHGKKKMDAKAIAEEIRKSEDIIDQIERQQSEVDRCFALLDEAKKQLDDGNNLEKLRQLIEEVGIFLKTGAVPERRTSPSTSHPDVKVNDDDTSLPKEKKSGNEKDADKARDKSKSKKKHRHSEEREAKCKRSVERTKKTNHEGLDKSDSGSSDDSIDINNLFQKKSSKKARKAKEQEKAREKAKCPQCGLPDLRDHDCRPRKCCNCGELGHGIKCPRPIHCTFCSHHGHTESACPTLSSRDKDLSRCINCLSPFHMVDTCGRETSCSDCGTQGHIAKFCLKKSPRDGKDKHPEGSKESAREKPPSAPDGSASVPAKATHKCCLNCGSAQHLLSRCPIPMKCWNCLTAGHSENVCRLQRRGSIKCINCYSHHHFINFCPLPLQCLACGATGHTAKGCKTNANCGKVVVTCPYNAAHKLKASELRGHLMVCDGHPLVDVVEGPEEEPQNHVDHDNGNKGDPSSSSSSSSSSSTGSSDHKRKKKKSKKKKKKKKERSRKRHRSRARSRSSSPPVKGASKGHTKEPKEPVKPPTPQSFEFAMPAPRIPKPTPAPTATTVHFSSGTIVQPPFCVLVSGFPTEATDAEIGQFLAELQEGVQKTKVVRRGEECLVGLVCKDKNVAKTVAFKANHKLFGRVNRRQLQATIMLQSGMMRCLKLAESGDPEGNPPKL